MSDLISRQAAIQEIKDLPDCQNGYSDTYDKEQIIGILEELSSEQQDGDMISRQAVNGIIDALFQNKNNPLIASPIVLYALREIQNLPSVNTQNALEVPSSNTPNALEALEMRWIPCSERLPLEQEADYWICTNTEYQCQCKWTRNRYGLGIYDKWGWKLFDIPQYTHVIAWQYLPEPYKAEE